MIPIATNTSPKVNPPLEWLIDVYFIAPIGLNFYNCWKAVLVPKQRLGLDLRGLHRNACHRVVLLLLPYYSSCSQFYALQRGVSCRSYMDTPEAE
jgi:hypothetical protein